MKQVSLSGKKGSSIKYQWKKGKKSRKKDYKEIELS
jgi:hypothetical protein